MTSVKVEDVEGSGEIGVSTLKDGACSVGLVTLEKMANAVSMYPRKMMAELTATTQESSRLGLPQAQGR